MATANGCESGRVGVDVGGSASKDHKADQLWAGSRNPDVISGKTANFGEVTAGSAISGKNSDAVRAVPHFSYEITAKFGEIETGHRKPDLFMTRKGAIRARNTRISTSNVGAGNSEVGNLIDWSLPNPNILHQEPNNLVTKENFVIESVIFTSEAPILHVFVTVVFDTSRCVAPIDNPQCGFNAIGRGFRHSDAVT